MFDHIEKLILVLGCQRSGTTVSGQVLGAPDHAVLIDETDGLYNWFASVLAHQNTRDDERALLKKASAKYLDASKRFRFDAHDDIFLYSGIRYLVLKAPNLTFELQALQGCQIPMVVAFPVRDPRSVVASMLKLSHIDFVGNQLRYMEKVTLPDRLQSDAQRLSDERLSMVERYALVWKLKTDLVHDYLQSAIPTAQFKYEDFVAAPDQVFQRVAEQLSLPYSDSMLQHEGVYQGVGPGRTDRTRSIDDESIYLWRQSLSTADEDKIIRICAPLMAMLGYSI